MNDVTEQVVTGGDVLVDTLIAHGVDTAFTVSGESFLAVLEALRRKRNQISLTTTRHEGGGSFAAEAFGKLTGRPAALFVSRGPGATNAAIGVHTAKQDCSPMLLFVGHVRSASQGREAFQEIDQMAMFAPSPRQCCSRTIPIRSPPSPPAPLRYRWPVGPARWWWSCPRI